jgi:hypothetical protein
MNARDRRRAPFLALAKFPMAASCFFGWRSTATTTGLCCLPVHWRHSNGIVAGIHETNVLACVGLGVREKE